MNINLKIPPHTDNEAMLIVDQWAYSLGINTHTVAWYRIIAQWIDNNPLWFIKTNSSGTNTIMPTYHNWKHMSHVTDIAMQIATHLNMSTIDKYNLFIACMFHDYGHSLGTYTDSYNINVACLKVKSIFNNHTLSALNTLDKHNESEIIDIIKATQYPFVIKPETVSEKIIRDADLTMSMSNDADAYASGLTCELSLPHKSLSKDTMLNFALEQVIFTDVVRENLLKLKFNGAIV